MTDGSQLAGLRVRNMTKVFGQTRALSDVSLDVESGSVLGLLGHNGSGKSTLFKILAGVYNPDHGQLAVNGRDVSLPLTSAGAASIGLTFVHQEIVMLPDLSVAENLFLDRTSTTGGRPISWKASRNEASSILQEFGLNFDVAARVAELGSGERTQLGIARAAHQALRRSQSGGAYLMLDEPTVFLSQSERSKLFSLIRRLAGANVGIVLVTHDLSDVMAVTDRVSVLRDGRVVALRQTAETSKDELAADIIGKERHVTHVVSGKRVERQNASQDGPVVRVRGMAGHGVHKIDFDLSRGEILGLTGLVGSGFSRILYMLYGCTKAAMGEFELNGTSRRLRSSTPVKSLSSKMILIPGNRRQDAIFASLSASVNIALPMLTSFRTLGHIRSKLIDENFLEAVEQFDILPPLPAQPAGEFSGGNQQKLVVAKWLQTDPEVVLIDEPTQGVDVGARQEILRRLRALADSRHTGIIVASSDYEQLAEICDRVIVVSRGTIAGSLVGDRVTADAVAAACLGGFEASRGADSSQMADVHDDTVRPVPAVSGPSAASHSRLNSGEG